MKADIIKKYFPAITAQQLAQFEQLFPLYAEWNEKINVISRKDIDNTAPDTTRDIFYLLEPEGGGAWNNKMKVLEY